VHIAALNLSLKWIILQRPFGLWRVRLYDTYDIIHTDPWYHGTIHMIS
jgi:hypothetical protein